VSANYSCRTRTTIIAAIIIVVALRNSLATTYRALLLPTAIRSLVMRALVVYTNTKHTRTHCNERNDE